MTPRPLFFGQKPKVHIRYSALLEGHLIIYLLLFLPKFEAVTIAPHNHITLYYSNHYMTERVSFSRLAQTE